MRILHVAETIKGGVGTYLNQIVPLQLRDIGPDAVHVIVPRQQSSQVVGIPPERLRFFERPGRSIASLIGLAVAVRRALRETSPDVIHAQSTFAGAVVRLMLALSPRRPRIIYCPHGWVFDISTNPFKRRTMAFAERVLSRLCDRIVAISEFEGRQAIEVGIPAERVEIVMNGIAASRPSSGEAEWDDARLKILFIGRLDRQKGLDILLRAVDGLAALVTIRVVGEAIHRGGGSVPSTDARPEMLGWRGEAEIDALLSVCDLVVMPSRWEGFGLVALEAMRAGKPVFAADVGGLPEIVVEGVTGHLFHREDVDRLRALIVGSDPETRARQGQAGRRRFLDRFTSERTHARLMEVYRQTLDARAKSGPLAIGRAGRGGSAKVRST